MGQRGASCTGRHADDRKKFIPVLDKVSLIDTLAELTAYETQTERLSIASEAMVRGSPLVTSTSLPEGTRCTKSHISEAVHVHDPCLVEVQKKRDEQSLADIITTRTGLSPALASMMGPSLEKGAQS